MISMHRVQIAFEEGMRMDLVTKDLRIVVSDEKGKLGELAISKGSIEWWSRYAQNSSWLPWARFDAVMRDKGRIGKLRPWRPIKARAAKASPGKLGSPTQ